MGASQVQDPSENTETESRNMQKITQTNKITLARGEELPQTFFVTHTKKELYEMQPHTTAQYL